MELFLSILREARASAASDILLKIGGPVFFRVDGELVEVDAPDPTREWLGGIIEGILSKEQRERLERDREIDLSWESEAMGRYRMNIYQQRGEFCMAMRLVHDRIPTFEELTLPEILKQIASREQGVVLVSGSTGSGKSTTLAAMIEQINATSRQHILTIEDPIEYVFHDKQAIIEQREIGIDTQNFETALKYVLRQDPDVIMLGEMRDAASFRAALSAADTGHLVLSTLHTATAPQAITRILEFFRADEREQILRQLSPNLIAVVCQRLVTRAAGGLIPAFEMLFNTPTVRKLIEENKLDKLGAAIEMGTEDGMINFNGSLLKLVNSGLITEQEALAKATNPDSLRINLRGIFFPERRIMG